MTASAKLDRKLLELRAAIGNNPRQSFERAVKKRPEFVAPTLRMVPADCPFCMQLRLTDPHECADSCNATLKNGEPCQLQRNMVARKVSNVWTYEVLPCWSMQHV